MNEKQSEKSKRRLKFGDKILNTSAGENNPRKYSTFVSYVRITGRMNRGDWVQCTDKKGNFWNTAIDAIQKVEDPEANAGLLTECEKAFESIVDKEGYRYSYIHSTDKEIAEAMLKKLREREK